MNAEEKVIRQRLSVLEAAQALGNVSEACRRRGVSRTQFYEHKNRFDKYGIEGLKDLPPIYHSHPLTTPPEVEDEVLALSLLDLLASNQLLEIQTAIWMRLI
jgi:hypothetical protein